MTSYKLEHFLKTIKFLIRIVLNCFHKFVVRAWATPVFFIIPVTELFFILVDRYGISHDIVPRHFKRIESSIIF